MRFLRFLLVLLAATAAARAAAPVITNIANFPSVSVSYTNYLAEGVVTNGFTLGGVRKTAWPSGGLAGTVIASGTPSVGDVARAADTSGTNLVWGTTLSLTALTNTALTASRAVVSAADKSLASSATTTTELGYVSGVTSAIQMQLDGKQVALGYSPLKNTGTPSIGNFARYSDASGTNVAPSSLIETNSSLGLGTSNPNLLGSGTFPGKVIKVQDNTQAGIGLETAGGFAEMAWMDTSSAINRKLWALGAAGGEGLLTLRSGTDAGGINNYIVSFGTNSMILNQGHVETGYTLTVGGTSWLNGNTTNSGTVHLSAAHVANKGALYVNGTDSGYIGLNAPASGSSGVLINRSGTNVWLLYTPSGSTDFVFGYTAAGTEKGAVSQAGVIRATSGFRAASIDGITTTWTNVISGVITQRISTIGGIVVTNLTL